MFFSLLFLVFYKLEVHTDKHMFFLLATERGQKGIHQARRQFREKTHDTDGGLKIF